MRLINDIITKVKKIDLIIMELEREKERVFVLERKLAEQSSRLDDLIYCLSQTYVTRDEINQLEEQVFNESKYNYREFDIIKDYLKDMNESRTRRFCRYFVIVCVMTLVIWLLVTIRIEWL